MSRYLRDPLNDSLTGSLLFHSAGTLLLGLSALLIFGFFSAPVSAISRQVSLSEMANGAGRVLYGRVAEVRNGTHPDYSHIAVTFVTLDVIEMIKGSAAPRITFMQFAGAQGQGRNFHLPGYAPGEEVLLFLYPESRYGFTSPVGEGQGKFVISNDPRTGRRALLNERGNRQLFEPIRNEKAMSRFRLTSAERELVARENGVADLETFRSLVRKLVAGGSTAGTN
jgi:hypothetical protein